MSKQTTNDIFIKVINNRLKIASTKEERQILIDFIEEYNKEKLTINYKLKEFKRIYKDVYKNKGLKKMWQEYNGKEWELLTEEQKSNLKDFGFDETNVEYI